MTRPKHLIVGIFAVAIGIGSIVSMTQNASHTYAYRAPDAGFFSGYFADMSSHTGNLHRQYGGQDTQGLIYFKDLVSGTYSVQLGATTKTCTKQIRGVYVNTARGNVIRPLDTDSLDALKAIDSSYNNLSMSGGWYTSCDGNTSYIYGQINHTLSGLNHVLIAGVNIETAHNTYTYAFGNTLQFVNNTTVGYLVDGINGVADVSGFGLSVGSNQNGGGGYGGGGTTLTTIPQEESNTNTTSSTTGSDTNYNFSVTENGQTVTFVISPQEIQNIVQQYTSNGQSIYTPELVQAYLFAKKVGITTQETIAQADMFSPLIRKHLAKFMVAFTTKILGKKPDMSRQCIFTDVGDESIEMQDYMTLACKLGIMGMRPDGVTPDTVFTPNETVTRAEFATAMSRVIYNGAIKGTDACFYCNHMDQLKKDGIMTKIDVPTVQELRGYVMLMMMRAAEILKK